MTNDVVVNKGCVVIALSASFMVSCCSFNRSLNLLEFQTWMDGTTWWSHKLVQSLTSIVHCGTGRHRTGTGRQGSTVLYSIVLYNSNGKLPWAAIFMLLQLQILYCTVDDDIPHHSMSTMMGLWALHRAGSTHSQLVFDSYRKFLSSAINDAADTKVDDSWWDAVRWWYKMDPSYFYTVKQNGSLLYRMINNVTISCIVQYVLYCTVICALYCTAQTTLWCLSRAGTG